MALPVMSCVEIWTVNMIGGAINNVTQASAASPSLTDDEVRLSDAAVCNEIHVCTKSA